MALTLVKCHDIVKLQRKQGGDKVARKERTSAITTLETVLAQKIRVKKRELTDWRTRREEAAKREEMCLREISEMEMAIAVFKRAFGLEAEPPPTDELYLLRYRSQTIAQSCFDMMRETGRPAKVVDLTKALLRAGKLKNYRTGYAIVTKTLDRDERFRKSGRGEYEIVRSPKGTFYE